MADSTLSFKIQDNHGRFVGPFGIMLSIPAVGVNFFELAKSLSSVPGLPVQAREIAILTVGAHFQAKYELYAHSKLAAKAGLMEGEIEGFSQGQRPGTSDIQGRVAFDVASELLKSSGPLRPNLWAQAVEAFGHAGATALVQFVGFYAYTCIILNGFDAQVPT